MSKRVVVSVEIELTMVIDEGIKVEEVINEMDYKFDLPDGATLTGTDIYDYDVMDKYNLD